MNAQLVNIRTHFLTAVNFFVLFTVNKDLMNSKTPFNIFKYIRVKKKKNPPNFREIVFANCLIRI